MNLFLDTVTCYQSVLNNKTDIVLELAQYYLILPTCPTALSAKYPGI